MAARVVFFDLGDTLGVGRVSAAGIVTGFDPFPFVKEVLQKLKDPPPSGLGVRLGVISNSPAGTTAATMATVLGAAGILSFFDPALLLYSSVENKDKSMPAFFALAATRAGTRASNCVFVGEDANERATAKTAGFATAFHPLHVFHVL